MLGKCFTDPVPTTRFRSDRISSVNDQYFFSTRERILEGPYLTRSDAERKIDTYIRRMCQPAGIQAPGSHQNDAGAEFISQRLKRSGKGRQVFSVEHRGKCHRT